MAKPLDSVGVEGYDTTLCSDKWTNCSHYDRAQFDSTYPGTDLGSISLYPLATEGNRDTELQETEEAEQEEHGSSGYGEE